MPSSPSFASPLNEHEREIKLLKMKNELLEKGPLLASVNLPISSPDDDDAISPIEEKDGGKNSKDDDSKDVGKEDKKEAAAIVPVVHNQIVVTNNQIVANDSPSNKELEAMFDKVAVLEGKRSFGGGNKGFQNRCRRQMFRAMSKVIKYLESRLSKCNADKYPLAEFAWDLVQLMGKHVRLCERAFVKLKEYSPMLKHRNQLEIESDFAQKLKSSSYLCLNDTDVLPVTEDGKLRSVSMANRELAQEWQLEQLESGKFPAETSISREKNAAKNPAVQPLSNVAGSDHKRVERVERVAKRKAQQVVDVVEDSIEISEVDKDVGGGKHDDSEPLSEGLQAAEAEDAVQNVRQVQGVIAHGGGIKAPPKLGPKITVKLDTARRPDAEPKWQWFGGTVTKIQKSQLLPNANTFEVLFTADKQVMTFNLTSELLQSKDRTSDNDWSIPDWSYDQSKPVPSGSPAPDWRARAEKRSKK